MTTAKPSTRRPLSSASIRRRPLTVSIGLTLTRRPMLVSRHLKVPSPGASHPSSSNLVQSVSRPFMPTFIAGLWPRHSGSHFAVFFLCSLIHSAYPHPIVGTLRTQSVFCSGIIWAFVVAFWEYHVTLSTTSITEIMAATIRRQVLTGWYLASRQRSANVAFSEASGYHLVGILLYVQSHTVKPFRPSVLSLASFALPFSFDLCLYVVMPLHEWAMWSLTPAGRSQQGSCFCVVHTAIND